MTEPAPLLGNSRHNLQRELLEAESMVRCPYFQREQKCASGCYSEPACITGAPLEGWEQRIRDLRELLRAA